MFREWNKACVFQISLRWGYGVKYFTTNRILCEKENLFQFCLMSYVCVICKFMNTAVRECLCKIVLVIGNDYICLAWTFFAVFSIKCWLICCIDPNMSIWCINFPIQNTSYIRWDQSTKLRFQNKWSLKLELFIWNEKQIKFFSFKLMFVLFEILIK